MFRVVVCHVFGAFAPVDEKVSLLDAISDPIKTHIHGFGAALFDGVVADAGGTSVVGLNWSGWLRMAHVFEDGAEHCGFFAIVEQGGKFSFGSGREDWDEDRGVDVDGSVGRRRR